MKRLLTSGIVLAVALLVIASVSGVDADAKADKQTVVKENNRFAVELYGQLRDQQGNLFFSPYSISTALGMTYAGARGETAKEMAQTLHFTLPDGRQHAAFGALVSDINGDGKKRGYQLSTANALWGQKGYPFAPAFLKLAKDDYHAAANEVDFAKETEKARTTINDWVEKETQNKIKDLLQKGDVTNYTRLVLTNAIYFKGDWASQFKKDLTREEAFHAGDKNVNARFMHQKQKFGYFEDQELQALEMPYVGKDLNMVVLLPKKADGLAALEKTLTAEKLAGWANKLRETEVNVALPKFTTTVRFDLSDTLKKMGMPIAFTESADFSGINDGKGSLSISKVVHKAFVDVNEEGTEAAAATGVVIEPKAVKVIPDFRADHPFVFLIRDKHNGSILFMGRIVDPQK